MSTAQVIADQIGSKALTMIGASGLVATDKGLQFKIGSNAKGVNRVAVELDATDTYTVRFYRITGRGLSIKVLAETSGVYADSLCRTIEAHTGLYTSL